METIENWKSTELATALDLFMYEHDTYEYMDQITTRIDGPAQQDIIKTDIENGNVKDYISELESILIESDDKDEIAIINNLIKKLKEVKEKQESSSI